MESGVGGATEKGGDGEGAAAAVQTQARFTISEAAFSKVYHTSYHDAADREDVLDKVEQKLKKLYEKKEKKFDKKYGISVENFNRLTRKIYDQYNVLEENIPVSEEHLLMCYQDSVKQSPLRCRKVFLEFKKALEEARKDKMALAAEGRGKILPADVEKRRKEEEKKKLEEELKNKKAEEERVKELAKRLARQAASQMTELKKEHMKKKHPEADVPPQDKGDGDYGIC